MMIELQTNDGVIKLSVMLEGQGQRRLRYPRYLRLVKVSDSCVLMPSDRVIVDEDSLTGNQKEVIEWLSSSDIFDQGARSRDLQRATNIPKGSFWRALKSLRKRALIDKDGKYGRWLLTTKGKQVAEELG